MIFPEAGLPVIAAMALRAESKDWERRDVVPDESRYRYVYRRVLERFGLECPHPVRTDLSQYVPGSFECKMCLGRWLPEPTRKERNDG